MEELADLIDEMEIDGKCNFNIRNHFLIHLFLENTDTVYLYFLNHGFIEELVEQDEEEEEEEEGGNKQFICFMVLMMIMVVFFWIFSSFVSLNFVRFLRFCFLFGFLLFSLL